MAFGWARSGWAGACTLNPNLAHPKVMAYFKIKYNNFAFIFFNFI